MEDLNAVASEYKPNSASILENELILNWYPRRIISRYQYVESLLELGLGHGFTAEIFAESCSQHVIVDGASVVIDQFRENHPNFSGELILDYFETYKSQKLFDVIVMGFVLEHVDDPEFILKRYKSFLKPGGKIYVTVPNAKSLNRRLGIELGLISDIYSLNSNDIAQGHKRQYCRDTLRSTLAHAGYRVTHEEGIYLKPLPLSVLKTLPDFRENLEAMCKVGIEFPDICVALLMEVIPE